MTEKQTRNGLVVARPAGDEQQWEDSVSIKLGKAKVLAVGCGECFTAGSVSAKADPGGTTHSRPGRRHCTRKHGFFVITVEG